MAIASSGAFTGVAAVRYCGLLVVLSSGDFTGDGTLVAVDRSIALLPQLGTVGFVVAYERLVGFNGNCASSGAFTGGDLVPQFNPAVFLLRSIGSIALFLLPETLAAGYCCGRWVVDR